MAAVGGEQRFEHGELTSREAQWAPVAFGEPADRVESHPAAFEHDVGRGIRSPPAERAYTGQQLDVRERLAEVVVGSEIEAANPVADGAGRSEHQNASRMPLRHERATHGVAGQHRKIAVEEHHVVVALGEALQRRGSVVHHADAEAVEAQALGQRLGEFDLVFHDQHAHRSSASIVPRTAFAERLPERDIGPTPPSLELGCTDHEETAMFRSTHRRAFAALAGAAVCASFLLTACSGAFPEPSPPATDNAATERFIACLQAGGLDARTSQDGRVLVKVPIDVDSEGRPEEMPPPPKSGGGEISLHLHDGSVYQSVDDAESFLEEWGITAIYADCETEVPEFEQPSSDLGDPGGEGLDPELEAAQTELLLAFAECARENGISDFPDPEDASMVVPESIDEATLRSILTACGDDLADSEAPLSVRLEGIGQSGGDDLGRVFEDFPELTDNGLMVSAGAGER